MANVAINGKNGKERIPLWLDCDPDLTWIGHDDAFAILLAAHHHSLHLLGVSTVHGNASLEKTTANAGSVLTAIGKPDVPVYPGAAKPFCRKAVHAPDIHGATGIDGTDLLPKAACPPIRHINAIVAMRTALMAQTEGKAWLVATGALTNVALLFATFPEVARHIKGLSIMGGAIGDKFSNAAMGHVRSKVEWIGNTTRWAEFNIYCDPEAAQAIFSDVALAAKTTLIPLDLTHQVLATEWVRRRLQRTSRPQFEANQRLAVASALQQWQKPPDSEGLAEGGPAYPNLFLDDQIIDEIVSQPLAFRDADDLRAILPEIWQDVWKDEYAGKVFRDIQKAVANVEDESQGRYKDLPLSEQKLNINLRKMLHDLLMFFATTYADVFGFTRGPPLHDPIAVAVLLNESSHEQLEFDDNQGERWILDVVTDGLHSSNHEERGQVGRTKARKALAGEGGIRIPRRLNVQRFWAVVEDCIQHAEDALAVQASPL